jgi:hypothetical protein
LAKGVFVDEKSEQDLKAEGQHLKMQIEANRLKFIRTELDLGQTFLQVAMTTRDPKVKQRNVSNATKAHDSALKYLLEDPEVTHEERQALESSLAQLKRRIDEVEHS